jgi:hypothetical protein
LRMASLYSSMRISLIITSSAQFSIARAYPSSTSGQFNSSIESDLKIYFFSRSFG